MDSSTSVSFFTDCISIPHPVTFSLFVLKSCIKKGLATVCLSGLHAQLLRIHTGTRRCHNICLDSWEMKHEIQCSPFERRVFSDVHFHGTTNMITSSLLHRQTDKVEEAATADREQIELRKAILQGQQATAQRSELAHM